MGCGKTSIGKKMAHQLNLPFIDVDKAIEQQEGMSISELFLTKGENSFRLLEHKFLSILLKKKSSIVSVGGGFPCFNNNLDEMKKMGCVIYLERNAKELTHRLLHSKKGQRPLLESFLNEKDLLDYVESQLKIRELFYKQAHFVLDRNNQKIEQLIESALLFYDKKTLGSGE